MQLQKPHLRTASVGWNLERTCLRYGCTTNFLEICACIVIKLLKIKSLLTMFWLYTSSKLSAHILNFHLRWRWWDQIQATFWTILYFNNTLISIIIRELEIKRIKSCFIGTRSDKFEISQRFPTKQGNEGLLCWLVDAIGFPWENEFWLRNYSRCGK